LNCLLACIGLSSRTIDPYPLCVPIQRAMGLISNVIGIISPCRELAHQVGMSKYRLSHRVREVLGVTFRDYLLRVRLERAKVLLADGHVSVTEVAQIVGFGDLPRFDKVFKRYTSVTPSSYRSLVSIRSKQVTKIRQTKLLAAVESAP